ncbi:hypothetical protein FXV77_12940 [Sphingobacterium phlebotomi]|uniref:Uncharacterized protein n=1 Tax=Sphingobacterium phlebotomi TaxID=2605433 RepID=A0A5D4H474_9SPHI|nr:hypothetical protein [Sphingobacterium phlebotomi]TYR35616.1 hypothetical protein FXV77_12940 [Sphingobacterium phlebotomi]
MKNKLESNSVNSGITTYVFTAKTYKREPNRNKNVLKRYANILLTNKFKSDTHDNNVKRIASRATQNKSELNRNSKDITGD